MNQGPVVKNLRLDQFVVAKLGSVSRSLAAKIIERGLVKVNNKLVTKPSSKMRGTDKVIIDYDPESATIVEAIDLPILFEDQDCVVIAKPTGILSHSKGAFNPEPTVASWLKPKLLDLEGDRAGIVHRLDRGTSGIMICAKTNDAQSWLQKQFSGRKVHKTYVAIVKGQLKEDEAIIDMPIERNPKKPQTFRVGVNGKNAVTSYKVLQKSSKYSLVELKPTTGRTHQLRVHLSTLGHPIVGDSFYGGPKADRLYLHASNLELTLPSRQRKTFSAKIPAAFTNLMTG